MIKIVSCDAKVVEPKAAEVEEIKETEPEEKKAQWWWWSSIIIYLEINPAIEMFFTLEWTG